MWDVIAAALLGLSAFLAGLSFGRGTLSGENRRLRRERDELAVNLMREQGRLDRLLNPRGAGAIVAPCGGSSTVPAPRSSP